MVKRDELPKKGDVFKIDFEEQLEPNRSLHIHATVMLMEDVYDKVLPRVIYLKTHDGHNTQAGPGDTLAVKRHVLESSIPASLTVRVD